MTDFRSFIENQFLTESQVVTEGPIWDTMKHKLAMAGTKLASGLPVVGDHFAGLNDTRQVMDQMIKMWARYRAQQNLQATPDNVIGFMNNNELPVPQDSQWLNKNDVLDRGELYKLFRDSGRILLGGQRNQVRNSVENKSAGVQPQDDSAENTVRNATPTVPNAGGTKKQNIQSGKDVLADDPKLASTLKDALDLVHQKLNIDTPMMKRLFSTAHRLNGARAVSDMAFVLDQTQRIDNLSKATQLMAILISANAKNQKFDRLLQHTMRNGNIQNNPLPFEIIHSIWSKAVSLSGREEVLKNLSSVLQAHKEQNKGIDRDAVMGATAAVWLAFTRTLNKANSEGSDAERAAQQAAKEDA